MQDDDTRNDPRANWRQEGPESIARGLEPDRQQPAIDESLWLALNAWG